MAIRTFETDRLILRPLEISDTPGMWELDSDPEVHRFLGNKPLQQVSEAEDVIRFVQAQYKDLGIGRYAVIEKKSGEFVGWSGLKMVRDTYNGHRDFYDLGYRLCRRFWNLGYATESALAWRDYSFEKLEIPVLFGMVHHENTASRKVLEKTGLQYQNSFMLEKAAHDWMEISRLRWEAIKG